jgi:hypothetical protein
MSRPLITPQPSINSAENREVVLDHHSSPPPALNTQMGSVPKVYGVAASPVVATVLLCLEEAGVAYELVPVDMAKREHKAPQRTNPAINCSTN